MDLAMVMKESGYSYDTLAKKVECSVGVLSKFISKGETIKFDIVLNIIKTILPEREKDFMYSYCLQSDKPNHLKCALEYAASNSNVELLDHLITVTNRSSNREVKEFGRFYQHLLDRLIGDKTSVDVFNNIKGTASASRELLALTNIIEMQLYYYIHDFKKIKSLLDDTLNHIDTVKDEYLKKAFTSRYNQMVAFTYLHVDSDVEKAREVAEASIELDMGNTSNGFFYNILATSYFGESTDKMNHYAKKSVEMYSENNSVVSSLKNRYYKLNMIINKSYHCDFIRDNKDPLDHYLEGVVENNVYKVLQCLVELNKEGSKFFTSLVVDTLLDMNCDESLIESIQTIH